MAATLRDHCIQRCRDAVGDRVKRDQETVTVENVVRITAVDELYADDSDVQGGVSARMTTALSAGWRLPPACFRDR
ncbi:MAG: hypothetical protein RLW61_03405 [Gammaproteobacteria bacterium]